MQKRFRKNPDGHEPKVHASAYIDPTAVVIGRVMIGKNVYVGPGAVIRADEPGSEIVIGDNCNIQDKAVIHALSESAVVIGADTSLAHACIVHGPCRIGKHCFIGFGSVVYDAVLEDAVFVKNLAVVEGVRIPHGRVIRSRTVVDSLHKTRTLRPADDGHRGFSAKVVAVNRALARGYGRA